MGFMKASFELGGGIARSVERLGFSLGAEE